VELPRDERAAVRKDASMTSAVVQAPAANLATDPSLKSRQQAMWASGDYAVIGTTLQIVGELLCEAVDLRAGQRVLDVAAGNGNATLAAARRFAAVTSTDYVPRLLDQGRRRAEAEGADVAFEVADVEALPYPDASFDVVLSSFGVMFTPDHEQAARELMRVCAPGGRIGLANWTPEGFVGQMFRTIAARVPPAPGVRSPLLWGTDAHIRELFGDAKTIVNTKRDFVFRYLSAKHFVDVFRAYYGPMYKAFGALDADGQATLEADLLALLRSANIGGSNGLVVPSEYVETVVTR
jgi:ubiquinone/menaquinone biosynthesis C-methylase UbiE